MATPNTIEVKVKPVLEPIGGLPSPTVPSDDAKNSTGHLTLMEDPYTKAAALKAEALKAGSIG